MKFAKNGKCRVGVGGDVNKRSRLSQILYDCNSSIPVLVVEGRLIYDDVDISRNNFLHLY